MKIDQICEVKHDPTGRTSGASPGGGGVDAACEEKSVMDCPTKGDVRVAFVGFAVVYDSVLRLNDDLCFGAARRSGAYKMCFVASRGLILTSSRKRLGALGTRPGRSWRRLGVSWGVLRELSSLL